MTKIVYNKNHPQKRHLRKSPRLAQSLHNENGNDLNITRTK